MARRSAVPSDLFPLVFSFLRENKLLSVAREFTKATGVKDQDPNAASLLDIFNNWLNSSGAKKRKLRSNGPSVTKKKKGDSSSSYDCLNEDDEPKVKQPAFQLCEAKKTALEKLETSPTNSESSSSDDSDPEKDNKRKPSTKSVSIQLKPTVAKHLQQKKPKKSIVVSEFNSSSPSEVPKNHWHPPISKPTRKQGVKSPTTTQKASNGKVKESSSNSNSSDDEDSSPEKKSPAKKMQLLHSAVVKPAACTPKFPCTRRLLTKVKESSSSDDSSDSSEDEKATIKSKPKSGSSSEEYEIKSKSSSKSLQAKAMVKPVLRKPTKPKDVSSSSDEDTESHSSEDETPEKIRTKASASKCLVAKAKSFLASTKSVKKSLGSNSSLSELEVKKKGTSEKKNPKEPPPCPKQLFMSEKKILAAPSDSSSDLDSSSACKKDTCNPAVKHKAVAHGGPPASIAGTSPTVPTKSILPKKGPAGSSSTSDSSGEEEQKPKKAVPAERVKLNSAKKAKSSCSDSSSDLETKQEKKLVLFTSSKRTAAVSSTKKKTTKKDNHNNNSLHSEEENSVGETGSASTHRTALKTKTPEKNEESSEVSSSSEEQQVNVLSTGKFLKKRKTEVSSSNQNGKERTSGHKALAQTPNIFLKVKAKKSQSAEPFRRVRDEEIEVDIRVGNNSFDAKRGSKGDWGEKANNVLKFTKGKSFRHEKTKKKRGNYCGGEISTSIKSIKFDSE